ncbi:DUF3533 domain-containing protein [Streptomyces cucumeris]|uniref:ABC transporter permease n=1 Tax=Streptomyces cucumeris TaxID=2962890 RepID=UPI003EBF5A7B
MSQADTDREDREREDQEERTDQEGHADRDEGAGQDEGADREEAGGQDEGAGQDEAGERTDSAAIPEPRAGELPGDASPAEEPRTEAEPAGGTAPDGFWSELRAAVTPRMVAMIAGALLLQLGFVLSYVGAFHHPQPHRVPIAVVAPQQTAEQVVRKINAIPDQPVKATAVADEKAARALLADGETSGALIVNPRSHNDRLLVAGAGGASTANAVESVITQAEKSQQRTVSVTDAVPPQSGDARGLSSFYLVVGWTVGGYLFAALLGVSKGARPSSVRRAGARLLAAVPYAVLSGLGGALIVGPGLGALNDHFLALSALGALVVFGAAAVTVAFQVLFGVLGIGVTVLLFVVLGNPSAGGAYGTDLLPPFWRTIGPALPNGAATHAVRHLVYFSGHGITANLAVLTAYALGGVLATLVAATLIHRRMSPELDPAGARA